MQRLPAPRLRAFLTRNLQPEPRCPGGKEQGREKGLISKGEKCRESRSLVGFCAIVDSPFFGDRSLTLIIFFFVYSWQPYSFFFRGGGLLNKCGTFEIKYADSVPGMCPSMEPKLCVLGF